MSHVTFTNSAFSNVQLSNIKSSYTFFRNAVFVNSTIIDTDMEVGREFDEYCVFNTTIIRGMRGGCARHADLTSRLGGLAAEHTYSAHAAFFAAGLALLPRVLRPNVAICVICFLISPLIYVAQNETTLYVVEAVYRVFITLIMYAVGVSVVESYPANLRCTAHGLILSVSYLACACVRGAGDAGRAGSALLCAVLSLCAAPLANNIR